MAVENLSVDEVVTTTADTQKEQAVDEVMSSGGVDVSAEANVSPDDILESATPKVKAEKAGPEEEVEAPAEEVEAETEEVEVPAQTETEGLSERATKRVQNAVNRAKEAELRLAEMQAQSQQQIAYLQYQLQQQMAQQQAAMREQQEFYRRQEQVREQLRLQAEEQNLTPAQKIEREWLEKAKRAALEELRPQLEQQKQAIARAEAEKQQAMRAYQERQMLQQYKAKADTVNRSVLFNGLANEDIGKLNDKAQELLLTWGTAAGEEPEQAALGFKQFLDNYYQARLRATAKSGAKLKQTVNAPKAVPTAKGTTPKNADGKEFKFDPKSHKWGFF